MIDNIKTMINILIKILPIIIMSGFVTYLIIRMWRKEKRRRLSRSRTRSIVYLVAYLTALICVTLIFREPENLNDPIDFVPFNTPGGTRYIILYAVANFLLFIPMGLLIPRLFRKFRYMIATTMICVLASVLIEFVQLVFERGLFQIEDIIMNTLGGIVGYVLYQKIWHKLRRKKMMRRYDEYLEDKRQRLYEWDMGDEKVENN